MGKQIKIFNPVRNNFPSGANGAKVIKKDLTKSQIELTVELTLEEFKPYILRGAEKVSLEVKIEGFRPGKVPYDILKSKIGEMTILEEAARIAVDKTIEGVIKENVVQQIVGQPEINITKLAPANPLEYKVVLTLLPEVKPGDYKNFNIKKDRAEVKEEEVDKLIEELREMRVTETISDQEIKDKDKIIVDIEIFLDKVPIEGGQGKGVGVIVGKEYIIPGFDKKLIGAKKGETREFELLYPAEHFQKNLAGKMAEFRVTVKEVYQRQLPEVNEEFIKNFGLANLEELRNNIKKSLVLEKQQKLEQKSEMVILDKIINQAKFGELPEVLIKHEAEVMLSELEYNIKSQGGKFEDYLTHLSKTRDQLMLEIMPEAVKRVKISLIIREIAKIENVNVHEHEIEKAIEDVMKQYKGDRKMEERVRSHAYRDYLENNLAGKKVMEKLREWNLEKQK